jgi:peptidoglycan/xylan/chitin deacetylase (PgdA/CDA1 family)
VFGTLTHVATDEPVAALTFDDGPHPRWTPDLLSVLEGHGARATFFMLGAHAAACPQLVERVAAAGHAIGNHGFSHAPLTVARREDRLREIRQGRLALGTHASPLFRPPYGGQTYRSLLDTVLLGYRPVTWSVHAEDWLDRDAEWIAGHLERELRPGAIVLLHDALHEPQVAAYADRAATIEGVDRLLTRLRGRYEFVTVPELVRRGDPVFVRWLRPALP